MQALLGGPGAGNHVRRCATLADAERGADEGPMSIVPGGFNEHLPQVRIAGFSDVAAPLFQSTGVLRWEQTDKRHRARRRRKPPRVPQFGGDSEGRQVIDAAESAQAGDACL